MNKDLSSRKAIFAPSLSGYDSLRVEHMLIQTCRSKTGCNGDELALTGGRHPDLGTFNNRAGSFICSSL
jgi:hypothetical protein